METRIAVGADVDRVTETIALAIRDDPVWGPTLTGHGGGDGHLRTFWRFFVENAVPHGTVFLREGPAGEAASVAVWLPPGVDELTDDQAAEADALLVGTLPPERFTAYRRLWELFDGAHPHGTPHMYLSLLATHPADRGRGIGQELLADTLHRFDADGLPAYLESTNPANDHRYARAGFRPVGGFRSVLDGAVVTTMWRDVPSA